MADLIGIVLLAAISVLSVRLGAFVVGLFRRDRYVVFEPDDWDTE